jgi:hypothetical protein
MIWQNYRNSSMIYHQVTFSSLLPTASIKYIAAQKLFHHKNSSSSVYSSPISRPVPFFSLCTTSDTLSSCFLWMIRRMWSTWTLSSLIHHLLIRHASYNNFFRRTTILCHMEPSMIFYNEQVISEFAPLRQVSLGFASKDVI